MTTQTLDPATLDQWYCLQNLNEIPKGGMRTKLLGVDLTISDGPDPVVRTADTTLKTRKRYGFLWATLGNPNTDVPQIDEADEDDRRYVPAVLWWCALLRRA